MPALPRSPGAHAASPGRLPSGSKAVLQAFPPERPHQLTACRRGGHGRAKAGQVLALQRQDLDQFRQSYPRFAGEDRQGGGTRRPPMAGRHEFGRGQGLPWRKTSPTVPRWESTPRRPSTSTVASTPAATTSRASATGSTKSWESRDLRVSPNPRRNPFSSPGGPRWLDLRGTRQRARRGGHRAPDGRATALVRRAAPRPCSAAA